MDPNIILPHITQFVNQHYESWDNAHPNQMWTNAQKAIVNNTLFIDYSKIYFTHYLNLMRDQ